jgi:hypothetical protein
MQQLFALGSRKSLRVMFIRLARHTLLNKRHTPSIDDNRPAVHRRCGDENRPAIVIGHADDDGRNAHNPKACQFLTG